MLKFNALSRIRFLSFLFFLAGLLLVVRLFYLQIMKGGDYAEQADRQYASPSNSIYNRGSIFFQEKGGNLISAASLKTSYLLAINPKLIADSKDTYEKLNPIVSIGEEQFLKKSGQKDDSYEVIIRGLKKETAEKAGELKLAGVNIYKERLRVYPANRLAAHLLGFVGYSKDSGDRLTGRYGLEKYYERMLDRPADGLYLNFFAEIFANFKQSIAEGIYESEGDIILSIEPTVQRYLEENLASASQKWQAETAGGMVIDPKTGKVLAMAALPDFDPNTYGKETEYSVFSNPLVENVFEMGSIVKPLTMAAALDAGVLTASTTYSDPGYLEIDGRRIENYDGKSHGIVNMTGVLGKSLNTGAVFAMRKLGKDLFKRYMLAYGLGEKTGIDLPSEAKGIVKNLDSKGEIEYATASYGQGIGVTPINMVRALSSLANGGVLVKPSLLTGVINKSGFTKYLPPVEQKRVLRPETSRIISDMLREVVDDSLAGGKAKMDHYTIAAKTGTAEIPDDEGGYYQDRYLHSFFGYFPTRDPKFLVFLYLKNPKGVRYASETLTEPFVNMTRFLLNYYEVAPDR